MNPTPQDQIIGRIFAQNLAIQSHLAALKQIIGRLAHGTGLTELSGASLDAIYSTLSDENLKILLLDLETKNPAMAAVISGILDRSRTDGRGLF